MANLTEITEGGGANAAAAAGGGTEGGDQGVAQGGPEGGAQGGAVAPARVTSQGQGSATGQPQANQPPPMLSRTAPLLSSVQIESVKQYVDEIRAEMALTTKNISAATYRVNNLDKLIHQIDVS